MGACHLRTTDARWSPGRVSQRCARPLGLAFSVSPPGPRQGRAQLFSPSPSVSPLPHLRQLCTIAARLQRSGGPRSRVHSGRAVQANPTLVAQGRDPWLFRLTRATGRGTPRGREGGYLSAPGIICAPDSRGYFPARSYGRPQFSPSHHLSTRGQKEGSGFLSRGVPAAWKLLPVARDCAPLEEVPSPELGLLVSGGRGGDGSVGLGARDRPGGELALRRGVEGAAGKPDLSSLRVIPSLRRGWSRSFLGRPDCAGNVGIEGRGSSRVSFLSQATSGLSNWITPVADATSPVYSNSEI